MSNAPVDPAEVPVFTGDLDLLESKVKALSSGGPKVATAGSDVHKSFGGLSAFYKAPEAEQLFGVTKPVADKAHDVSKDVRVIAGALGTYAREIRPLVKQLEQLKQDAAAFRANEAADADWREDGDLIEENLSRRNKIAEVWAAFQAAERDCHAKIVGLVGGHALHAIDSSHKTGYGYDAEALKQSKSLPWGDAVEESVPWWQVWEHAYDFGKGIIVDGVGGTIKGLGTLIGVDGWDAAGKAWTGLAKLSTGITITMMPGLGSAFLMAPGHMLPSWLRDSRTAMVDAGKAFVAWDQWESNGSRAAGAVTFNVLTAIVTRGGGAAVEGAGKAATAAKALSAAGKVGQAIDPMTYVFKGAGAGVSKIGDVMAHLKDAGHIEAPKISEGAYSLPEGSVTMPDGTVHLPKGTPVPDGATKLPDGNIKLPEDTVTFPPNTVKDPTTGKLMSGDDGALYNKDGSLFQPAKDVPKDEPAPPATGAHNPRIENPVRQEQPVLAGVGGRGDDVTRVGSDISDSAHAGDKTGHSSTSLGDNTPMGRAGDHGPSGGNAGNHMPATHLDNAPTRGGTRPGGTTPQTGGGHTDSPSTSGGHSDSTPIGGHGSDRPTVPHQGDYGDGVGTADHDPHIPEGSDGTPDHNVPGSASNPEEALSPDTHVGEDGAVPPPGHGQKLLEQIDVDGSRVTNTDGVITHVDGRPVADYLDELAQKRGAEYRDARDAGAFPRKQTGACVGSVMDLRTGTIIEGINGKADVVIKLDDLHPTLRERLETIGDPPPHKDDPLGHAEVKAANELLWMRTRQGLPDDAAVLAEMRASVDFPYLNDASTGLPGRRAPFCANCNHMLQGLPSSHGKFTGFPPSDENWIP
ncbi:hypothetical protein ACGFOU_10845 [Streptomyces sp. NPDC048595]|uniref:hypothetical protein n=1 Tax=Streptomyces sp. NPDC048595 TaxID=3365576 RepID=UPI00371822B5